MSEDDPGRSSEEGRSGLGVAELHIHLEGSMQIETAIELAGIRGHRWGALSPSQLRRLFRYNSLSDFLQVIRDMCAVLSSLDALERVAFELSLFCRKHGTHYAEVYCSPYIYVRWGLDFGDVVRAIDRGFLRGEQSGGARCMMLLDSVRQWGAEAAGIVVSGYESEPLPRIVGFGLGGEELVPLEDFANVYSRARDLGLRTLVHAGETGPASDVRKAVEVLQVDRIAHGIRAVDDAGLVAEIAERKVPLDVSVSSNYRTGAVRKKVHPLRQLLDAGVVVTLSTDDPSLFRTNINQEYRRAVRCAALTREERIAIARNAVAVSFAPELLKMELSAELDHRLDT